MRSRPSSMYPPSVLALTLFCGLSGCAVSPLVNWAPPDYPGNGAVSMNYAMRYARSARDAYRTRMYEQVQQQGQLAGTLLGIGALATGAAVARMHRDVYAGLAFAGGTGYAFGQQNLRPERLRVYLAGIAAMDCAIAVVSPLDLSDTDITELRDQSEALEKALSSQEAAKENLRSAIAAIPNKTPGPEVDSWNAHLAASATLQAAARTTATSAQEASGKVKQAAAALVNSVDRVRTEVDKAALETLPSLDAVGQAIASLPTLAGRILPGSKLDERIFKAVAATAQTGNKAQAALDKVQPSPEIAAAKQAQDNLVNANRELAAAAARVSGLLARLNTSASTAGLNDCKVAGVVAPLIVNRTELRFAGGKEETLSFVVSGGVPPYNGSLLTGGATGVTVRNPAGNDTRFDVTVAASVTQGSFELLVQDRANGQPNSVGLNIEVGNPSDPTAPGSSTSNGQGNPAATMASFMAGIGKVASFSTSAGHRYTFIRNDPSTDGGLTTQLKCEPKAGQTPEPENNVRTALVQAAQQQEAYTDLFANGGKRFKLTTVPTTCMTPAAP